MPLYTYTCPDCWIEVEEIRPINQSDEPLPCPICGKNCERGLSMAGLGRTRQESPVGGEACAPPTPPRRRHGVGCPCCYR